MSGTTVTTLTPVLLQQIHNQVVDSVYKYGDLLKWFPRPPGFVAGANFQLPFIIAGNSSVQKADSDDPLPAAGYQQSKIVTVSWQNYRVLVRLTGDARRAAGAKWSDQAWPGVAGGRNFEFVGGLGDLTSYVEEDLAGTGTYAFAGQIDDGSTNFHDTDRSVYTTLQSHVVAGGAAAVSVAKLNELVRGMRKSPHGGRPRALFANPTQGRKIADLVYGKLALSGAGDVSGAVSPDQLAPFSGLDIIEADALPEAIVFATDPSHWVLLNHEPEDGGVDVLEQGIAGDAKTQLVIMSLALLDLAPHKDGRLENLATT